MYDVIMLNLIYNYINHFEICNDDKFDFEFFFTKQKGKKIENLKIRFPTINKINEI